MMSVIDFPHVPTAHEVETFSGRYVDVSNPRADSIVLEDIAHALSNVCRYGGHCSRFYSVAEHAVFVSLRLQRKGYSTSVQLGGLHHDDSEAFLGDIPRPMKPLLGEQYKAMTRVMDEAIVDALDELPRHGVTEETFHDHRVKAADNWSLFVEARALLPSQGASWWDGAQGADAWDLGEMPSRIIVPDYWLGGLPPEEARELFLARHRKLVS